MYVRKARISDIEGIMNLLYQVAGVHHKGRPDIFKGGCSKYSRDELENIIVDSSKTVFVAVDGEKVLGHAFCVLEQSGKSGVLVDNKSLYIDDICVDETCRGKHIGTMLCNKVLEYAREEKCYNVTLNVWCLNAPAIAFYKALGFKEQKIVMESIVVDD